MSKFKLFFFVPLIGVLLVGCELDDTSLGDPIVPSQTTETASLTFQVDPFYERGEAVNYTVTLPGTSTNARQVRVESQAGVNVFTSLSVADAGASESTGSITIPDLGGSLAFDERGTFSAAVVGARQMEENEDEELVPIGGDATATISDPATVSYFDNTPAQAGGLNILFDWEDPAANDLDLEVIDEAFTTIFESSASGSRYESDLFQDGRADGNYVVYYSIFDTENANSLADIQGRLFFVDSSGSKTLLEFTIPAGTPTNARTAVAIFAKSTVDGADTYSNPVLL